MKHKSALLLMEQLVMVLVFALAAALCLQTFAKADQIAAATARREEAAVIAQSAAEALKAGANPEDLPCPKGYTLKIRMLPPEIPGLVRAEVAVEYGEGLLFSLTTGWQEVRP